MTVIEYSILLCGLIAYARNIGTDTPAALTAERFLVAVHEYANGEDTPADVPLADTEDMAAINDRFRVIGGESVLVLLEHIKNEPEVSGDADEYMASKLEEAREYAEYHGYSYLGPAVLIDRIISDPTDAVARWLEGGDTDDTHGFDEAYERWLDVKYPKDGGDGGDSFVSGIGEMTKKAKDVRDRLSKVIFGQDHAVNIFSLGYFQSELRIATDPSNSRPSATFLFAGAPGVGKTHLAKEASKLLGIPFMYFDMSEYADSEAYMDLIGFNKNYKDPEEGKLTHFVKKHPRSILLFDEIEKAHATTVNLFLQILDGGELTDRNTGEEISFDRTVIIFTTNAGRELYNASGSGDFSYTPRKTILRALQRETDPVTGGPFFPAEICSRLASGNVIMFNNMNADTLCRIAKNEAERIIGNFREKYGIPVSVGKDVYTALLFSEGVTADARSVKSRTEKFINDELFELFRFLTVDENGLDRLASIGIEVELPKPPKPPKDQDTRKSRDTQNAIQKAQDILKLFINDKKAKIMLFSKNRDINTDRLSGEDERITVVRTVGALEKNLRGTDVSFAVIDLDADIRKKSSYLNIEDIDSDSRKAFWYVRENHPDIPVYVLLRKDNALNVEEQRSLTNNGVRGFIPLDGDGGLPLVRLGEISDMIYQQCSLRELTRSNCILDFETGQTVSEDGKTATITLFDFEMSTAVDAEDTGNLMSSVSRPNVLFDEIIGAKSAKDELGFFIKYLKNPKSFAESGLRAPKGVLLYGPPGTGKTMLAKATACEAGVTFISAQGNQFIKKYLGEGKDSLHDLFSVARKYSPAILFIDEFEAIAKERVGGENSAANGEDVLTALLTEMDGFDTDITRPVFVLAATNFDIEPGSTKSLDQAVLRRFDSKIYVDLPNLTDRREFIKRKTDGNDSFDMSGDEKENLAARSIGLSLADLDSVFELSLRMAIRKSAHRGHKVTYDVIDRAFETFIGGEEKEMDESQIERVARHEAGHAYICWRCGRTPSYLTVVARGDHGGYVQHNDAENKGIYTKEELLERIRMLLGGRAAETVYYGEEDGISTGAADDLERATHLARQIICRYGMEKDFGLATVDERSLPTDSLSPDIREAVNAILDGQMKEAVAVIEAGRDMTDRLVRELRSQNHMTGEELERLFENAPKGAK